MDKGAGRGSHTGRVTSRFDATTSALDVVRGIDLSGKRAIVTGGGSGIGLEITRALAAAGAEIMVADVDLPRTETGLQELKAAYPRAVIRSAFLDLGDLASVRSFANSVMAAWRRLDILINNAGVMAPPKLLYSKSGHELQFGVNYLGHYCLTTELLAALRAAGGARVVCVSSIGHRLSDVHFEDIDYRKRPYERWEAYGQSKTACSLLAVAITANERDHGITANALNPGGSMTGLQRHMSRQEMVERGYIDEHGKPAAHWRPPALCAATSVWAATAPELEGIGGLYLENCNEAEAWCPERPSMGVKPHALSRDSALRLWELAGKMVISAT